jgi:aminoglycoside phosphotransferase (APT) family kinase protein
VHKSGIPSPETGEVIEVDGRRGLLYERLEGVSMLENLNARPWLLWKHARALAELHVQIHRQSITGLPFYKDRLGYDIRNTAHLSQELKHKTLALLERLPGGENLCHGDFHPGNVLITQKGPVVIDWMTACVGNPWTDVARSSLLLSIGAKGAGKQVSPIIRTAVDLYHRTYLNRYQALSENAGNELKRWKPVIAAARLSENIIPEREALIKIVEEGLAA